MQLFSLISFLLLRTCFESDMGDRQLIFWTTKPNRFLVIVPESQPEKVLGCVACKPIDSCTVQVNHMSVARYSHYQVWK